MIPRRLVTLEGSMFAEHRFSRSSTTTTNQQQRGEGVTVAACGQRTEPKSSWRQAAVTGDPICRASNDDSRCAYNEPFDRPSPTVVLLIPGVGSASTWPGLMANPRRCRPMRAAMRRGLGDSDASEGVNQPRGATPAAPL
jgi:hypothetical protein